ncbi:hypothetical protein AB0C33_00785 [Nonomuraea sp. NPDC048881]|uniref:hypothetical protein n=1 Tax=Nonomuraea sp. NPDC048881 TaxID=3155030 RepID=UPI0033C812BB
MVEVTAGREAAGRLGRGPHPAEVGTGDHQLADEFAQVDVNLAEITLQPTAQAV